MLVEIHQELENIDDQYTEELRFEDIDQEVFSFKQKVHNWQINQKDHPKVVQSQVQSPALPGHQKGHQQKKWQLMRS